MINDMAILPCQATSRLPTTIDWLKNGETLNLDGGGGSQGDRESETRYRKLVTGTLQISDLRYCFGSFSLKNEPLFVCCRKSDTGVYTCRARNEDGDAEWTASLLVEEHTNPNTIFQRMPDAVAFPTAPGRPLILNISEESVELEWTTPERQGASPISGYLLQYWSPQTKESWVNVLEVIPNTRFRVKHLRPSRTYAFVVRAENSKGIGPPSAVSDLITLKYSSSDGKR